MVFKGIEKLIPPEKRLFDEQALKLLGTPFNQVCLYGIDLHFWNMFLKNSHYYKVFGSNLVQNGNILPLKKDLFYFVQKKGNSEFRTISNIDAKYIYFDFENGNLTLFPNPQYLYLTIHYQNLEN